jgi:hypothetical protein
MTWVLIIGGVVLGLVLIMALLPILLRPKGTSVQEGQAMFQELMRTKREERLRRKQGR